MSIFWYLGNKMNNKQLTEHLYGADAPKRCPKCQAVWPANANFCGYDEEKLIYNTTLKTICPDCGGEVQYYHSSIAYGGDGITRVVCKKKCQGWKVLQEMDREAYNKPCSRPEKTGC